MTTTAAGLVSTTVSTDQLAPLGFELEEPASSAGDDRAGRGPRIWVYVENAEPATAFAVGTLVQRNVTAAVPPALIGLNAEYRALVTTGAIHPQRVLGVAQHVIAFGSFGFVLKKGVGQILCDGNVSINAAVTTDANAGQATDTAAVTGASIGVALATDAGAATLVACALNCVG